MKQGTGLKTKCYYTDYVNHMIRFYLTCPDSLDMVGKRKADVDNWIAVQAALHSLPEADREKILAVYRTHYNLPNAVRLYCQNTETDERTVWVLITKVLSQIAKRRGLV